MNPPDKKKKLKKFKNNYILPTTPGTKPLDVIHKIKIKHKDDERVINTMELVEENYRLKEENEAMHNSIHEYISLYATGLPFDQITCEFCEEDETDEIQRRNA